MKFDLKVILKGVLIALCICIGTILAARYIDRILFEPKSVFARTVKGFEAQKDQIQILFLGQSDMKYAIIPKTMPYKSYNFAEFGENYIGLYLKLKHYIDEMPRLKIVVLPLPLESFASGRIDWIGKENFPRYFSYGYVTHQDFKALYNLIGFDVVRQKLASFSPMMDKRQVRIFWKNIRKFVLNKPIQKATIEDGYFHSTSLSGVKEGHAIDKVRGFFREENDFEKNLLSYFEKILILCHDRKVKVVTLMLPVTDYYLKHAEKYVPRASLYEKVILNPKLSPYIFKHLDCLELYAKDHSLFVDVDHLNHKGATLFSQRMISEFSEVMEQIQKTP
jgi:hypothetical protein